MVGTIESVPDGVEWRVWNFLSLSSMIFSSPHFSLLGESWTLWMHIRTTEEGKGRVIKLWLSKRSSSAPVHLHYSLSVKTRNGRRHEVTCGTKVVQEIKDTYSDYIALPSRRMAKLVPDGVLTVICTLQLVQPSPAADCSQEEIPVDDAPDDCTSRNHQTGETPIISDVPSTSSNFASTSHDSQTTAATTLKRKRPQDLEMFRRKTPRSPTASSLRTTSGGESQTVANSPLRSSSATLINQPNPTASTSARSADAFIEDSTLRMEIDKRRLEREEIEHNLRIQLLKKEIEVQQKNIDVQIRILEILDNNPQNLTIKF